MIESMVSVRMCYVWNSVMCRSSFVCAWRCNISSRNQFRCCVQAGGLTFDRHVRVRHVYLILTRRNMHLFSFTDDVRSRRSGRRGQQASMDPLEQPGHLPLDMVERQWRTDALVCPGPQTLPGPPSLTLATAGFAVHSSSSSLPRTTTSCVLWWPVNYTPYFWISFLANKLIKMILFSLRSQVRLLFNNNNPRTHACSY